MKMTKEQAIAEFKRIRAQITGAEVETDDGLDAGDLNQNSGYAASLHYVEDAGTRAWNIDIDGVSYEEKDTAWRASCKEARKHFYSGTPEHSRYQAVDYIDRMIAMLSRRWVLVDDATTKNAMCEEVVLKATTEEEAISEATAMWRHMSRYDQKRRDAFYIGFGVVEDGIVDYDTLEKITDIRQREADREEVD